MPSHPDRVRKFSCEEHNWHIISGVVKADPFYFVLNGYECLNCKSVISRIEYSKLVKDNNAQLR